jgi:hypothetical protein
MIEKGGANEGEGYALRSRTCPRHGCRRARSGSQGMGGHRDTNCVIELQYPPGDLLKASSTREFRFVSILLKDAAGPETAWLYAISVKETGSADRQEMDRAGTDQIVQRLTLWKAELHCVADGPDSSTDRTDTRVRVTVKTKHGKPGFEIETAEVAEPYGDG